ncbi:MAG: WD40/YVTN/BNR-like repeat-containing protein [Vicinamibacterales bacterium]
MRQGSTVVRTLFTGAAFALLVSLGAGSAAAQTLPPEVLKAFPLRSIGPTAQGGRFVDFAVPEQEPHTIYAATGSGGLWKSVNDGHSWMPIFDNERSISIGDIAVAPSNPNVVWVGTGEATSSRSTYWGDGVYKSTDAGKSWTNMGLPETHHIGRIVIDPKDPNIVYVAALGKLYSENPERGVYKTTDGGKTWTKSLDVKVGDRAIGACDIVMDPKNPRVLYAATYDKERKPWTFNLAGPGSGIYKTTDAGKTWTKLTNGLPSGMLGRIGLDVYLRNPNILYANIENGNKPGMSDEERLKELREGKSSQGMIGEEVYRSDDAGKTWRKVSPDKQRIGGGPGYYYMQVRIDPNNPDHVYVLSVGVTHSTDGGKTWSAPFRFGGDNHGMWIDPKDSKHIILGYDHGMGITYDGGQTWLRPDNQPLAQFYAIAYDMMYPYNVYGGLQDNGSVRGPSTKRSGRPIAFEDWQSTGGGDGMYNVVDTVTNRYLYNESQFGPIRRVDLYTGEAKSIRHPDPALRWNWNAPILVSHHDPATIYHAANKLLKSTSRGDSWVEISPDLSTNDRSKLTTGKGGDGNIQYCTITTIDESPIVRDLLYVGTDDGNVWVTKDGGKNWTKLNEKIKGNPGYWVTRVAASPNVPGTAYVTFSGYRNDDFRPFIYKTTDYGETWTSIAGNLPSVALNVVREDPKNPNVLYAGGEFGLFVSIDAGKTWTEMRNGMPTQPVYDLQIHPRENDLIVATHGRGVFITDVTALQELDRALGSGAYLFEVEPKVSWVTRLENETATLNYDGQSEPNGIVVNYYLKSPVQGDVVVRVLDGSRVIAETKGPNEPGINRVLWNMRVAPMTLVKEPATQQRGAGGRGAGPAPAIPTFGATANAVPARPGEYTVEVIAGGKTLTRKTRVIEDVWFDRMW